MIEVATYFDRKMNQAMKNQNKQVNRQVWKYKALSILIVLTSIGLFFAILFTSDHTVELEIRHEDFDIFDF